MTGLEKILGEIKDEAQNSAGEIVKAAQQEADAIIEKAKVQAEQERATIKQQSEAEVADYIARAKSAAALQQRKNILNVKQQLINDVIEKAQESLLALPDDKYFDMILKMVEKYALPQKGEILFSDKDLKRLPKDLQSKIDKIVSAKNAELVISKEACEINGGFVLTYGGIEENCTFEALFDSARETLQDKVHEILF